MAKISNDILRASRCTNGPLWSAGTTGLQQIRLMTLFRPLYFCATLGHGRLTSIVRCATPWIVSMQLLGCLWLPAGRPRWPNRIMAVLKIVKSDAGD